jgi:flotillin
LVAAEWQAAGRDARDLYVLQHLEQFVEAAVTRVQQSQIGELTVVDGGDGSSYTSAVASFPAAVAEVLEQTGRAIGIDVPALLASGGPPRKGGA